VNYCDKEFKPIYIYIYCCGGSVGPMGPAGPQGPQGP